MSALFAQPTTPPRQAPQEQKPAAADEPASTSAPSRTDDPASSPARTEPQSDAKAANQVSAAKPAAGPSAAAPTRASVPPRGTEPLASSTRDVPEAAIDEALARAAAEAYRDEARQAAILMSISTRPDVARLDLTEIGAEDASAPKTAYSDAKAELALARAPQQASLDRTV